MGIIDFKKSKIPRNKKYLKGKINSNLLGLNFSHREMKPTKELIMLGLDLVSKSEFEIKNFLTRLTLKIQHKVIFFQQLFIASPYF